MCGIASIKGVRKPLIAVGTQPQYPAPSLLAPNILAMAVRDSVASGSPIKCPLVPLVSKLSTALHSEGVGEEPVFPLPLNPLLCGAAKTHAAKASSHVAVTTITAGE